MNPELINELQSTAAGLEGEIHLAWVTRETSSVYLSTKKRMTWLQKVNCCRLPMLLVWHKMLSTSKYSMEENQKHSYPCTGPRFCYHKIYSIKNRGSYLTRAIQIGLSGASVISEFFHIDSKSFPKRDEQDLALCKSNHNQNVLLCIKICLCSQNII